MSSPSMSDLKAYDEIYGGDPGNMQALRELFPPDNDVGARNTIWMREQPMLCVSIKLCKTGQAASKAYSELSGIWTLIRLTA